MFGVSEIQDIQEIKNIESNIFHHNIFLIPGDKNIKFNSNLIIYIENDQIKKEDLINFEKDRYNCRKIVIEKENDLILLPFLELNIETSFKDLEFEEKFSEIITKIQKSELKQLLKSEKFDEEELFTAIGVINNEQDENQ